MSIRKLHGILAAFVCAGALLGIYSDCRAEKPMEERRELNDLSPISPTNPVVARVDECNIEISASEFRGYMDSLQKNDTVAILSMENKKKLLDSLLDDHFLLWKGYEEKADQSEEIQNTLSDTKNMLLTETLIQEEVVSKEKSPADRERLTQELRDRLFDKTDITVLGEGYKQLQAAVKSLNGANAAGASTAPAQRDELMAVPLLVRLAPLATSKLGTVTTGNFLKIYFSIDPAARPDLAQHETIISILKQTMKDQLFIAEAKARGMEQAPIVQEKLQMNRNVLTRMHVIDELTAKADAMAKQPDFEEQVRKWYQKHLATRYTYKDSKTGLTTVVSYEKEHEMIRNDCVDNLIDRVRAEAVAEMRKGRHIEIDDRVLAQLQIKGPLPSSLPTARLED